MTQTNTTIEERRFEEAFANIPPEVEDFMWSDAYTIIVDALQETLGLTDEQKELTRILSYEFLLGLKNMPTMAEEMIASGMTPELAVKVLYLINNEIVTRAQNITEFYAPHEEESSLEVQLEQDANSNNQTDEANPNAVLETLKNRLTVPVTIPPIARSVGEKTGDVKKIDPYREMPGE